MAALSYDHGSFSQKQRPPRLTTLEFILSRDPL